MSSTPSSTLFSPIQMGPSLRLPNRIFMAPLTRVRAGPTNMPNALMVEYYAQRASAGLIISESIMVAPNTSVYGGEPGLYTSEQADAWKCITEAVHAKGGRIFAQLWHAGRTAHPDINQGVVPVGPSAIAVKGNAHTLNGKLPHVTPHAASEADLPQLITLFVEAAKKAVTISGFDGVEIHGAIGYLVDQFLCSSSNTRTDGYGGSLENRARFLRELLAAVTDAIGADKVGLRTSPCLGYSSTLDSDPLALSECVAKVAQEANLVYLHVIRSMEEDILSVFRTHFHNTLIANMGYSKDDAENDIAQGKVDAVAFGNFFIGNPDLPARFAKDAALNETDYATSYGDSAKGYTDYPTMEEGGVALSP
ncbi:Aste57867_3187 [Aphanomyces stellatus]|uniref:Aste57867_3187 protein n=1 Tax=Aphanomyces stellatus TaxID=120398 RepID=A0A485K9V5_9STRA|nr:hypothetical protein As57867_003178 [Aphanomyces stellatus]VFT80361.1 Aste57867_3187 [Aphanomyces stellatus]